jgi:hypothetical protein
MPSVTRRHRHGLCGSGLTFVDAISVRSFRDRGIICAGSSRLSFLSTARSGPMALRAFSTALPSTSCGKQRAIVAQGEKIRSD